MLEVHCNVQLFSATFNLHPLMGKPYKPKLTSTHFYAFLPHFYCGHINARILTNKARSKNARMTHVVTLTPNSPHTVVLGLENGMGARRRVSSRTQTRF
jgi:hypothetical protein